MVEKTAKEDALEAENVGLREHLAQAGVDAARILAQAGLDAIENETAKRLQRLLLEELHHRVKNTLATVIAITSQSLRHAENLEQGRLAVESRLRTLGRAHDVLLQSQWTSAKLTDVLLAAIEPFNGGGQFLIQETKVEIGPGAVLPFTLSLNELCTNALKYGALSTSDGRVEIKSTTDEAKLRFNLTWTEAGGPPVKQPRRHSFGTRLMTGLAHQLGGHAHLNYEPTGLVFELDVPLTSLFRVN